MKCAALSTNKQGEWGRERTHERKKRGGRKRETCGGDTKTPEYIYIYMGPKIEGLFVLRDGEKCS